MAAILILVGVGIATIFILVAPCVQPIHWVETHGKSDNPLLMRQTFLTPKNTFCVSH